MKEEIQILRKETEIKEPLIDKTINFRKKGILIKMTENLIGNLIPEINQMRNKNLRNWMLN